MQAMPNYPVACRCGVPAQFKIAAEWNDGATRELKTYFLSCADCLRDEFRAAGIKQRLCRRTPGETLDPPNIYELAHGSTDRELVRRRDLEG